MVWYRTTFILHYEPTRLSSPTRYTSPSTSARRSRRKNPEIVHAVLCLASVVKLCSIPSAERSTDLGERFVSSASISDRICRTVLASDSLSVAPKSKPAATARSRS